jgi:3-phosphoshikimate 1-carboxyvinyltransferase
VRALGIDVEGAGTEFTIHGKGLDGLRAPAARSGRGNSGSTIRMLSGILAGQPFAHAHFRRRIAFAPPHAAGHEAAGADGRAHRARDGQFPPLRIQGGKLRAIDYTLPVPSAQVKTCVLFAGSTPRGETTVTEPVRSRDHTEIALREFGADLRVERQKITIAAGLG